ncbi:cell division protein FtsL [Psychrobacter sp. 2Y5]|uniref:cell division protein FtsL n=1 Tax=unclassified Psychrobacter TaxID=196806 RepID=UPI003F476D7D
MAISGKPKSGRVASSTHSDVGEMFAQRFSVINIYVMVLLLLAAGIVWSGIKTAEAVQQYHQDYKTLQDMKKQQRKLQVEHQRLLIEQQTFSATPQIASRAVAELGMYSPTLKDKLIIQPGAPVIAGDTFASADTDNSSTDVANTDLSPENPSAADSRGDGQ